MQHYYDPAFEPDIDPDEGRPEFGPDGEPAFYAVCGADMRTCTPGKKCPECAEEVRVLGLIDQDCDGGVFAPSIFTTNTNA